MLLAIDVGNTETDFGVFSEDGTLMLTHNMASDQKRTADEYRLSFRAFLGAYKDEAKEIKRVIISSVVPSLKVVWAGIAEEFFHSRPLIVGPGLKTGVRLNVDNPSEVGGDIVAAAAAGASIYGPKTFIADLGTASKYILIDEKGAFSGLAIAPGIAISMNALVNMTAALPEVTGAAPKHAIGTNTVDCMNSGIAYGGAYEAEGFADAFEKEAGYPLQRVITGGNSAYVRSLLPDFSYRPHLVLEGLALIERRNR
jgi:type III pantothenate kinase